MLIRGRKAWIAALLGFAATIGGGASGRVFSEDVRQPPPRVGPGLDEYRARRSTLAGGIREVEAGSASLRGAIARAEGNERPTPSLLIVVVGKGDAGDDARFHQDNDFHYLTGVDIPHASAILRVNSDSVEETLYLPPRDRRMERYSGPRLSPGSEASGKTGFARVAPSTEFLADLFRGMADRGDGRSSGSTIYLIDTEAKGSRGSSERGAWLARIIRDGAPGTRVEELAPRVHELRKTKTPAEVALLRRAIAATGEAQRAVARLAGPKGTENQLEGAILNAFTANGATRAGFPSIVGSGLNSTVLHYDRNDRTMEAGDLVVVDIGAEIEGYTADITRTFPVGGRFTPRQREIYQLVLDAQSGAAREVRPGDSTIGSLNRWVVGFFRASPLRAKDDEGVERTMDHFFPHGLGHHLGLDVHDVGDASKPLKAGQVFTIEPGLYLPLEGFGVRIEDDYLVTPTGVEKLSASIPSAPDEVERAMAARRDETNAPSTHP